jgi:hypothetical protein
MRPSIERFLRNTMRGSAITKRAQTMPKSTEGVSRPNTFSGSAGAVSGGRALSCTGSMATPLGMDSGSFVITSRPAASR